MTVSRHILFGKLGSTLFKSVESATAFCKLRGNPYVELVHCLHQILQLRDSDVHRILHHCDVEIAPLERDMARALAALPAGASSISDFSSHFETAIERAWIYTTLSFNEQRIRSAWLLVALLKTPELRRVLLGISSAFQKIPLERLCEALPAWIDGSVEAADAAYDGTGFSAAMPGEASGALPTAQKKSALEQYCADLTALARQRAIDPVVGRDLELRTMIDVLLRRRQNNPLLTGEAGVGKTAVVEGLALAIATGVVPPKLAEVRLLSLDVGALLAGASMKGEFEARLKGVLEAAANSTVPIILFVDEIHTLVGAGGQAGTGDAANLLKPALARGTVRMIGATTWAEYKRHIEKDPALTRRFQVLQVREPEVAAAIEMVRGLAQTFAQHHQVEILDEAIRAAVTLSHRYMPSRQLPDKAISLLDTACARVALSQHAPPAALQNIQQQLQAARVEQHLLQREAHIGFDASTALAAVQSRIDTFDRETGVVQAHWQIQLGAAQGLLQARASMSSETGGVVSGDAVQKLEHQTTTLQDLQHEKPLVFTEVSAATIADVVADWTGIPVGRMVSNELTAVMTLPATLDARVIGQPAALRQICERIQTARAGLTDPHKPIGVFLLVGPSGVGKTETALALAEALYGGEQNLITINLTEYQEAHTVSGLKGAPPGYVGYGEGGVLTEAVRRRPYSVVLLDEVEKAHPDIREMFFQVFDKGYMEDGDGRFIDFKNTTILLTSNVGAEITAGRCAEPASMPGSDGLREALMPELLRVFPAAFIGRVSVVPYLPLAHDTLAHIVRLHLNRVVKRMADQHDIVLAYVDPVVEHIVERCQVQETGARVLIGFIEQHVLPKLSALWLDAFSTKTEVKRIEIGVSSDACNEHASLNFLIVAI